jgi:serine/threonine-protein kinase
MASESDDTALGRVGTVINQKYRLEQLIGSGGMASVYRAVHQNNGNRVAIKMLHARLSINADLHARFLREGYVANKVEHRGAVRVLDDGTAEDQSVFLVMELLEGETLKARLERNSRPLPAAEVCELAHQLLEVLAAAHAKGVVHRDLKPDNLFLTREGVLKVLDFGIARLAEAGSAHATQTGRTMGTPAFMPPEQALGRTKLIDGQTDLWAVGATMFTLVSGQLVHDAETPEEMVVWAGSRPARSVSTVSPGLAPVIAAVIDRALESSRDKRWADARTMDRALVEAYQATFGAPMATLSQPSRPLFGEPTGSALSDDSSFGAGGLQARVSSTTPASIGSGTMTASFVMPPTAPHGVTTTAGVVNGATGSKPPSAASPSSGPRVALWGALGIAASLAAIGGVFLMLRQGAPVAPPRTVAHALPSEEPLPPVGVPPPAPTMTVPAADMAESQPEPAPAPSPIPVTPRTTGSVRRPPAPATSPASVPAHATPAGVAPKPNCDLPFYVDSQGIQRIRPECK